MNQPIVQSTRQQAIKAENLKDLRNTPIYKQEIEGFSELQSIIRTCPEPMILELANLVRDPADPYSFTNKVLLDMALKRAP